MDGRFYEQLNLGKCVDPHAFLGLHDKGRLIRVYRPGWREVIVQIRGSVLPLPKISEGIFEYRLSETLSRLEYKVMRSGGGFSHDPYTFFPTFTEYDESCLQKGEHEYLHRVMGGRITWHEGVLGVKFAVWAPCASGVSLVGDFNEWHPYMHPMRRLGMSGVWELFIPDLQEGEKYKFVVMTSQGQQLYKADPFAFQSESRPKTASIVRSVDHYRWQDHQWMEQRKKRSSLPQPINIYELHLGSWKKEAGQPLNYKKLAPLLANYCKMMSYTHVELMPIMEHHLDESWGYQVTGFYAISQRYGEVEDFQYFVDYLHRENIGVILDWVPGHFPSDSHFLARFDGTCLYEHLDPRQGYHPHWHTYIFNYGRYEVRNFLLGSAIFYLETMHIDGLRVDAVSSIVYLNFGRQDQEWIPNREGGHENLEGIFFLQELNRQVHEKFPGALMIAEESHAYPGITEKEGLGFDFAWSLGWMNDTLSFFQTDFSDRKKKFDQLLSPFHYCFFENYVLSLSHDEVVHLKKSLLSKMPGNEWQKFANLRLLLSYMICCPGKKLLFMGGEIGQWHEWNCKEEIGWDLLQVPYHQQLHCCMKELYALYSSRDPLWYYDNSDRGFAWLLCAPPLISYFRKGPKENLLCIHNFYEGRITNAQLPIDSDHSCPSHSWKIIFSTDRKEYGGLGEMEDPLIYKGKSLCLTLPPLTTLILSQEG